MRNDLWSADEDAMVIGGRRDGLSAQRVADLLGNRTRMAVMGRWHRLGLCVPPKEKAMPAHRVAKRARAPIVREPKPKGKPVLRLVPRVPKPKPIPVSIPCENPVAFLERRKGQCSWPLWGEGTPLEAKMCCGSPCGELSQICPAHAAIAYIPDSRSKYPRTFGVRAA